MKKEILEKLEQLHKENMELKRGIDELKQQLAVPAYPSYPYVYPYQPWSSGTGDSTEDPFPVTITTTPYTFSSGTVPNTAIPGSYTYTGDDK